MLSTFEKILILHKVPFFKDLSTLDLKIISDICEETFFQAGDHIIKKGEEGGEMYILETGKVKVMGVIEDVILEPPAHIGEIALLSGKKRTATIQALTNTNTLSISREKFRATILKFPHIVFPITAIILDRILEK